MMNAISARSCWRGGAAVIMLCVAMATLPLPSMAQKIVHLSPSGSTGQDGSSTDKALPDLSSAMTKALELLRGGASEVKIAVAAGTYTGQSAEVRPIPSGKTLVIGPDSPSPRPVFDGSGSSGTWLGIRGGGDQSGTLIVRGLEVINYRTAISLNGDRERSDRSVKNVKIIDNVFRRIGQVAFPQDKPSTAAIRLVNADNIEIRSNRFSEILNVQRCALLHSLYIAHGSTRNEIRGNSFLNACGDSIRFRDGSGDNLVQDNTFEDAWDKAPISDWYCDASAREDCTKASGECPSSGNVLINNRATGKRQKFSGLTKTYGEGIGRSCPRNTPDRFLTR